jgi:hypothetical protein
VDVEHSFSTLENMLKSNCRSLKTNDTKTFHRNNDGKNVTRMLRVESIIYKIDRVEYFYKILQIIGLF